ncbi:hypothetical protein CMEL01_03711, partial [Colletotrichum melonis]
ILVGVQTAKCNTKSRTVARRCRHSHNPNLIQIRTIDLSARLPASRDLHSIFRHLSPPSPIRQPSPAMLLELSKIASASSNYGQVRRQATACRRLATDADGPGVLMSQFFPASSHYPSYRGNAVSPFHRHSEAPEIERWLKA